MTWNVRIAEINYLILFNKINMPTYKTRATECKEAIEYYAHELYQLIGYAEGKKWLASFIHLAPLEGGRPPKCPNRCCSDDPACTFDHDHSKGGCEYHD